MQPLPILDYSDEQREAFALGMLRFPDDPFRAAMQVFKQPAEAWRMSQALADDVDISERCGRLLDLYGDDAFLPTQAEAARAAYSLATDPHQTATANERVAALRLYGELRGWIGAKGAAVPQKPGSGPAGAAPGGVMLLPAYGQDSEWEKAVADQQRRLAARVTARQQ